MSSNQRWRINVENLEARIKVGIHPHEREPQRVLVNAIIEADYARKPKTIADCYNYEHVHHLVTKEWPKRPHVELLETYVTELLEYIFRSDKRVVWVRVSLSKPDVFTEAKSVGVEAQWSLKDFERYSPR